MHKSTPKKVQELLLRELPSLFVKKAVTALPVERSRRSFDENVAIIGNGTYEAVRLTGGEIYFREASVLARDKKDLSPWINLRTGLKEKK